MSLKSQNENKFCPLLNTYSFLEQLTHTSSINTEHTFCVM